MNKSPTRTPAANNNAAPIRVLKIGKCNSFSGKSKLTYQIGSKSGTDVYIRIVGNTGSGFFSVEWIPLSDIENISSKGKSITSRLLFPLFKCRSINSPFFLLAALYHEDVVQKGTKKKRTYEASHPDKLRAEVKRLYATGVNLEAGNATAKKETPAKETPKPEAKSPAVTAARKPTAKKSPGGKRK